MLDEHRVKDWIIPDLERVTQLSFKNSQNLWAFVDYNQLVFEDLGNDTRRARLNGYYATLKAGESNPSNAYQLGNPGDYLYIDKAKNLTIVSEQLAKILK